MRAFDTKLTPLGKRVPQESHSFFGYADDNALHANPVLSRNHKVCAQITNRYKEEGTVCGPLGIRAHEVVLQFQILEGEATYRLFSIIVVLGWRRAVARVTKRPEIADRGLPPEDPFFLANQPPPFRATDTPHGREHSKIPCVVYDTAVQLVYDRSSEARLVD